MAKKFVYPLRGKTDSQSIRIKETALEAYLNKLEEEGIAGPPGPAGPGVPAGGNDGQVLTKTSSIDHATAWETPASGGGGADSPHVVDTVEPGSKIDGLLWTHPTELAPADSLGFTYVQGTAASLWTINHPLPFQPNVTVIDSAGEQVEGSVDYLDADTIAVAFSAAFAGTAYLS